MYAQDLKTRGTCNSLSFSSRRGRQRGGMRQRPQIRTSSPSVILLFLSVLRLKPLRFSASTQLSSVYQVEKCQVVFGLQDFGALNTKEVCRAVWTRGQGPGKWIGSLNPALCLAAMTLGKAVTSL